MFRKKKVALMLIISIIILLLSGCVELSQNVSSKVIYDEELDGLKVHFIDVGQGSSVFIVGADGKTMLYDAGGDDQNSGRIIVDYIKGAGYENIDVAIFTHPHADHINGAPTIFEELKVDSVYYPKVTHTTRTFEKFVEAVSKAGLKFKTAKAGVEIPFGETNAVLVAPISDKYENLNDYSATIKLTWKNTSVLLTGDVEETSENEMINSNQDLDIDLLLVPHHGSNSSTTDKFLEKTTPNYAIISSGKDNSYGHPHKEVMDRLNERNIKTYNTAEFGTIVATLDGKKVDFTTVGNKDIKQPAITENEKNDEIVHNNQSSVDINIEDNDKLEKLDVLASISDSRPRQNSNIVLTTKVTSNGNPVEGAKVNILNHYKSSITSYEGVTDKNGIADISYKIGRASVDFEVKVDVIVTKEELESKTQVLFIPQ